MHVILRNCGYIQIEEEKNQMCLFYRLLPIVELQPLLPKVGNFIYLEKIPLNVIGQVMLLNWKVNKFLKSQWEKLTWLL